MVEELEKRFYTLFQKKVIQKSPEEIEREERRERREKERKERREKKRKEREEKQKAQEKRGQEVESGMISIQLSFQVFVLEEGGLIFESGSFVCTKINLQVRRKSCKICGI